MKKVFWGLLSVVVLAVAVVIPISAEMSSEEQNIYNSTPIKCPECGQQIYETNGDGDQIALTWRDIKDTIDYDTANSYTHYCDNCQTEVILHFWACKYSSCRICLPTTPGDVCPECHAYQVMSDEVQEMVYGSNDAESSYYAGTVLGYEKGAAAASATGYEAGYEAGYNQGKRDAQESGGDTGGEQPDDITGTDAYQAGYEAGKIAMMEELEAAATTNKFYVAGASAGYQNGYNAGYSKGKQDGYSSGYSQGYNAGYAANQAALKKAQEEAAAAKARYNSAYQEGVQAEVSKNFISLVGEIAAAPFYAVQNMFNFEIFGVNVASVLLAVFTAIIVVAVIAFVLKIVL